MYTIIMKRGSKPDLIRERNSWSAAFDCASSLAELHGLQSKDIIEDEEAHTFTLDASEYYS